MALRLIAPASGILGRRVPLLPRARLFALGGSPLGIPALDLAPLARLLEQVPRGRPVPLPLPLFLWRHPAQQLDPPDCSSAGSSEQCPMHACCSRKGPHFDMQHPRLTCFCLSSALCLDHQACQHGARAPCLQSDPAWPWMAACLSGPALCPSPFPCLWPSHVPVPVPAHGPAHAPCPSPSLLPSRDPCCARAPCLCPWSCPYASASCPSP